MRAALAVTDVLGARAIETGSGGFLTDESGLSSFEAWQAQTSGDTGFLPELSVIALRAGQVVGAIQMYDNADGVAFIGMTAVHPDHRRAGIARAMKTEVAARAARAGWRQLETFNDGTNERMLALNLELGYAYLPRVVNLKGPLPDLPEGVEG